MLERQAHLEANDAARAAILSEAAKLAESLGDTERALSLWERRDRQRSERSSRRSTRGSASSRASSAGTISSPRSRAAPSKVAVAEPEARRPRARRAVHHQQRSDLDAAISAWQRVVADTRTTRRASAPSPICSPRPSRWTRDGRSARERVGPRDRAHRRRASCASATRCAQHLDEPARALAAYRNAIAIDPASKEARAGPDRAARGRRHARGRGRRARAGDAHQRRPRRRARSVARRGSPRRRTIAPSSRCSAKPRSCASSTSTTRPARSPISRARSRSRRAIS